MELKTKKYTAAFAYEVLKMVLDAVDDFQKRKEHNDFKFTDEYRADIVLTVGGYVLRKFEEMLNKNSPPSLIEELRATFYTCFEKLYQNERITKERLKNDLKCEQHNDNAATESPQT